MLFDFVCEFLIYYLALLLLIALMGMKFAQKHHEFNTAQSDLAHKKSVLKGLYKHCPCRKAVENGLMSSICIYSGIIGFMLSVTNIALISTYSLSNFILLFLSVICAYFGWILKK